MSSCKGCEETIYGCQVTYKKDETTPNIINPPSSGTYHPLCLIQKFDSGAPKDFSKNLYGASNLIEVAIWSVLVGGLSVWLWKSSK